MKRRVRCRFSGATQRAPGRPLQRSRRRLRKVSGRAMATKRRMADKRPEARGEAPGRHASKWGLRAGIGIELVEFLAGLEEFVRQDDSGSADVGLQLRHAGRPDAGSPEEALAEENGRASCRDRGSQAE